MRKKRVVLFIIVGVFIALSLVQVVLSNSLSTTGIALSRLENEVARYQRLNSMLRETILTETSLTKIASSAATFGFLQQSSQIVIDSSIPIAARP